MGAGPMMGRYFGLTGQKAIKGDRVGAVVGRVSRHADDEFLALAGDGRLTDSTVLSQLVSWQVNGRMLPSRIQNREVLRRSSRCG